ncbi:MAG: DUF1499 domain-containing protein [Planctomycetes bacterium]|nr:DUF1499 domain-containing protein [Planctomycetota bacterium]
MLIAILLVVLAILGVVALQVDDWSRDLTTNRAATRLDAPDRSLRSLELSASVAEVTGAMTRFVERSRAWAFDEKESGGEEASEADDIVAIGLTRTSQLFRFVDDVRVFLQPTALGTRVDITSQSRVGKGDLGQNPRNIRTLLQVLRNELDHKLDDERDDKTDVAPGAAGG